jgi:anti-sigma factor RsiW
MLCIMTCINKNIKEILPGYLTRVLDVENMRAVENHLAGCSDCATELILLRSMTDEVVPDPGEAFWNSMPDRVYQAVQRERSSKRHFDFSWFTGLTIMPRWVFASAAAGAVLIISCMTVLSLWTFQHGRTAAAAPEYLVSGGILADDSLAVAELTADQAEAVNIWAATELTTIGEEVAPIVATSTDMDISDDIADLNINEAEHVTDMLKQWKQEG